jgi:thioredoxin-related protein
MKKISIIIIYLIPFLSNSQQSDREERNKNKGLTWENSLTWEQIKVKAKQEKKYIFVDCYTTWCGPCKLMEKEVYPEAAVGDFMNNKFICVKVQMDVTAKDNALVRSWYPAAASILQIYEIEVYPTFLFFNPSGELTQKNIGAGDVKYFLEMVESSLTPGKIYNTRIAYFKRYITTFDRDPWAIKKDSLMPMLIVAREVNDTIHFNKLMKAYENYISTMYPNEKYITSNIVFWNALNPQPDTQIFGYFYKDGKYIDQVMGQKGYSDMVVDRSITTTYVKLFLDQQSNTQEPKWKGLEKLLLAKFTKSCVARNMAIAKELWTKRISG